MQKFPKFPAVTILTVALESGIAGLSWNAEAAPACKSIPSDDPEPSVVVCEDVDRYLFRISEDQLIFDKAEWQARASSLIVDYAKRAGVAADQLAGGTVNFWLSVPEAAPGDAHGRAIVRAGHYLFVVNLPISLDIPEVSRQEVADLDGRPYPDYLGHRVGSVLVKKAAGCSAEAFTQLLSRAGAAGIGETAGGWTGVYTHDFDETAFIRRVNQDPLGKPCLYGANLNSIFEWIAWREPVFNFALNAASDNQ